MPSSMKLCDSICQLPSIIRQQRRLASCLVSTKSGHAQGLSSLCIRWEEWRQYGGRSEDCLEVKPERWIMEKGTLKQEPSFKFMHSTQVQGRVWEEHINHSDQTGRRYSDILFYCVTGPGQCR
ncbi:uncharacterized protein A4U43_C03F1510 [Asparagus officinalis]|uniref:Uncharacterized protein n=1 Tax=Asparagus officinalis TaxID=4686 RepID=A0A5P1F6G5_ASPOF|nr:uncharacterized protein A4U43_C03F1510 [Asparagus officinalis]